VAVDIHSLSHIFTLFFQNTLLLLLLLLLLLMVMKIIRRKMFCSVDVDVAVGILRFGAEKLQKHRKLKLVYFSYANKPVIFSECIKQIARPLHIQGFSWNTLRVA